MKAALLSACRLCRSVDETQEAPLPRTYLPFPQINPDPLYTPSRAEIFSLIQSTMWSVQIHNVEKVLFDPVKFLTETGWNLMNHDVEEAARVTVAESH